MLKYNVELRAGGFTPEELKAEGVGGADAVVIVSIVRDGRPPHSGAVSFAVLSADSVGYDGGDVPEIPVTEMFQVMTMLCNRIEQDESAPQWQRVISTNVLESVRDVLAKPFPVPPMPA
jgi:hypothetical protein